MELTKVTDCVWFYPFEKERDRPILGYIKGDHFSVAVDAGHSEAHTKEFYSALEEAGLPLPNITVLTHWHWDHTFGMNAVNGLCIANCITDSYLRQFKKKIEEKGDEMFLSLDACIRKEYEGNKPVIITFPDIVFSNELTIDAGNCPIKLLRSNAPHTDDSTLVFVEREKVLFLGDAAGGTFPTWVKNLERCSQLADTIDGLDVDICLESHHIPQTKQEIIDDLNQHKK
ncbi:MAG: MBL fold metallo-hydrolase [Ruminococcus sp.]|nr:MBL fold metallo-hydrolase [Ruminococcus sp.]